MNPLISVIIPVYQVEPYVVHCIESVINQTYRDLEIILVDDGSVDKSGEICDLYAERDERIRVIHQENRGLSEARNKGIEVSRGEYLSFIDGDDWVDKRFINVMYEISTKTGCDIVQCNFQKTVDDRLYEDEREGNYTVYSSDEFSIATYTLLSWKCNVAWNKLYKASLFDGIRYPAGKIHEDEFTTYRLVWEAGRIAVTHTKLYFYRQRTDSIMGSEYSLKRLDAGEAYRKREAFYQEKGKAEILNLVRTAYWEWIRWQIPLVRNYGENAEEELAELERERKRLEKDGKDNHFYKKGLKFHGYLFPFAKIPYGSRIVLYGAGDVGTQYYRQIMESNYCDVIAWIDGNAEKYKKMGFPVKGKNEIDVNNIDAEYIVIAINNNAAAKEIIDDFAERNGQTKIIYEISMI